MSITHNHVDNAVDQSIVQFVVRISLDNHLLFISTVDDDAALMIMR